MDSKQLKIQHTKKSKIAVDELILLAPEFLKAKDVEEVEVLFAKLEPPQKHIIFLLWPLKNCEEPEQWGSEIAQGLSLFKLHESPSYRDKTLEMHEYYYELLEQHMNDEIFSKLERIDNAIDRTLKRLMQWKTMKQMFRQLEPKAVGSDRKARDKKDRKSIDRVVTI